MRNRFFVFLGLYFTCCGLRAQQAQHSVRLYTEVGVMVSSARQTPFWFRANQFGTVPLVSPLGTVRVGSSGLFLRDSTRRGWYWGYGAELVGNAGPKSQALLPEAYAKAGFGAIEIRIGRRKEVMGLVDSTLSSGSYAWSGNAIPIPKIQIGTNGFTPLKFTHGLISINAFFAHGWFANTDSIKNSYLHQKAFYGRIGKPNWKIKLYGGILHNAQWGGRSDYLGRVYAVDGRLPSSFQDLLAVIAAGQSSNTSNQSAIDLLNQVGNHLGSIDLGADFTLPKWNALVYFQHPFEDKSGLAFVNRPDGLYGLRLKSTAMSGKPVQITRLVLEYLTTMDQSGATIEINSRLYEGQDDYFNNDQYLNGWTSKRQVIGTPFLTTQEEAKTQWREVPGRRRIIVNNRVQLLHFGFAGIFASGVQFQSKLSVSQNFGVYRAPFRENAKQFSGVLWLTWPVKWLGGSELRTALALDQGKLLNNSLGGWVSLRKTLF